MSEEKVTYTATTPTGAEMLEMVRQTYFPRLRTIEEVAVFLGKLRDGHVGFIQDDTFAVGVPGVELVSSEELSRLHQRSIHDHRIIEALEGLWVEFAQRNFVTPFMVMDDMVRDLIVPLVRVMLDGHFVGLYHENGELFRKIISHEAGERALELMKIEQSKGKSVETSLAALDERLSDIGFIGMHHYYECAETKQERDHIFLRILESFQRCFEILERRIDALYPQEPICPVDDVPF